MNNQLVKQISYVCLTILSLVQISNVNAQCSISITASSMTVPCGGGQVTLTAAGSGGATSLLNETFNSGGIGPGWQISPAGRFNNPCDASYDGNTYMWMGNTTAAPRTLTTNGFDVSCGGEVCFYLDYSTQGGGSPCEGPDLANEGVNFEYSTDGGASWTLINYFNPNGGYDATLTTWNQYCFPIPAGAETTNTMFQWFQDGSSGNCCDHWGIDDVEINAVDCSALWYDWSHISGTTGPAGDNPVQVVNVNSDTTFTVTYTDGAGISCTESITITVDEVEADFTYTTGCDGVAMNFTDASVGNGDVITSWNWDFTTDGSFDDNTSNTSNVYSGPGLYDVTLSVSSAGGCSDQITQQIEVYPVPTADFTQQDVCDAEIMTFTDGSTIATGSIVSWAWDFGDGTGTSTAQSPNYTYGSFGNYDVELTVTSDDGCSNSYILPVNVFQNPTAAFDLNDVCFGDPYILNDNSNPNGGVIDTWLWSYENNGTVNATTQNTQYTYPAAGTYDVELTVETVTGCSDQIVQTVTVLGLPTAQFTATQECQNVATVFTDQSTVPDGAIVDWEWDFTNDGTIDETQQNPTNVMGQFGSYTTELTVTSNLGCSNSTTGTVTVHPLPDASFSSVDVCDGDMMYFTDLSTVVTGSIADFQWDFGDFIGSDNAQNTSYIYQAPGNYNVVLTVTTDNGCVGSVTNPVEVFNSPTANFTFNDACEGFPVHFSSTSQGNGGVLTDYGWDFTSNGSIDFNGTSTDNVYAYDGLYDVNLFVMTADGCLHDTTKTVTIHPTPVSSFFGQDVCEGNSVQFTNNSSVSSGQIATYDWFFGNGNSSNAQAPSELYQSEGVYYVILNVTSDQGCVHESTQPVEIYPTPAAQFITNDVCDGSTVVFSDFSSVSNQFTNNIIVDWEWDFGTAPVTGTMGQNASHMYSGPGTYTVTLDIETNRGCVHSVQNNVTVNPNPVISFESPNPDGCSEWCPTFVNTSTISSGSLNSYFWDLGDGTASTDQTPVHCYTNTSLQNQTFNVTLTAVSDFGCSTTGSEANFITVYPNPIASFDHDPLEGNIYNPTIDFIDQSSIADIYSWTFANLGSSAESDPSFTFPNQDSGVYEVCQYVETIYGCNADTCAEVTIIGYSNIYVPNAFTPDGDGVNDTFLPSLYGISESNYTFMVFDRWGLLLFQTDNIHNAWDGYYNGELSPQDVYVWKIQGEDKYNGETIEMVGHITLVK